VDPAVDVHEARRATPCSSTFRASTRRTSRSWSPRARSPSRASAAAAPEGASAHRLERVPGTFERAFRLRAKVDSDATKASYKDGVLTIDIPKAPEAVKREVAIELG
jgi:hypothetical protein